MGHYIMLQRQPTFIFHKENIFWQMQDLWPVIPSWCHIMEYTTISRNGVLFKFSEMICQHSLYKAYSHYDRPKNHHELFNLCHAQAQNVIEQIFGIVKHCFQLLVAAPEYNLCTQAQRVPALLVLHNFILIHDKDDIPPPNIFCDCGHH